MIWEPKLDEDEQLDESLSRIVYHFTDIFSASNILKTGEFQLSSSLGGIEQSYAPKGYPYFFSTARTPRGGYSHYVGPSGVMFVIDGNYYNQRYVSKPVDYWQDRDPGKKTFGSELDRRPHEAEDRLFSKEPSIPINGVTAIHIFSEPDASAKAKSLIRKIILNAKQREIPVYYYTNKNAWKNLDTTKTASINTLSGTAEPSRQFRRHRGWLMPWIEIMMATDRNHLSDNAKSIVYNMVNDYYINDTINSLSNDIFNARKPGSGPDRDNLIKINRYMQKNKLNTIKEFVDAMKNKWKAISKS